MNNIPLKIIFFYCANSTSPDEVAKFDKIDKGIELTMISLPCSGKVNLLYLLKAIETGADAVILLTCLTGSCQFLEGNLRAQKRADAVNSILKEAGLGNDRIILIQNSENNNADHIISEILKKLDKIRKSLQLKKETV